jgi:protein required for attachment to host cells
MSEQMIDVFRDLIDRETEGLVLSVFCRTDPRDPANSSDTPGWLVALRNGLRDAAASVEGDHEATEAVRRLSKEAEGRLTGATAHERGRSVALFLSADGSIDIFHTFQIPVREDFVGLHEGVVIWPAMDLLDRGQRTGLVLLSQDRIRLLEWEDGIVNAEESSVYDLELGDWREYRGSAAANRTQSSASHVDAYEDRKHVWRTRFVKEAAKAIAESARDLKIERLVTASDAELLKEFRDALPQETRELLVAEVATNLIDLSSSEVSEHLDQHLRDAWRESVNEIGDHALERIQAGERGAGGPDQVLLALIEGRVEHLLFDPFYNTDPEVLSDGARRAVAEVGEGTAREAAVETALRTGARVSSASVEEVPALAKADGALALLRY